MPTIPLSKKEKINVYTHAAAVPFCLLGSYFLLTQYGSQVTSSVYFGILSFCLSATAVFTISALYHYQTDPRKKYLFRIADHIAIYFLIAGTHSPLLFLFLPTTYGYSFIAALWVLTFFGIIFKIFFTGRYETFSVLLYLGMAWSAILTFPYIWDKFPENAFFGIILGGISYTIGTYFYVRDHRPYYHAIWHLFVIGGNFLHFWAIWLCMR